MRQVQLKRDRVKWGWVKAWAAARRSGAVFIAGTLLLTGCGSPAPLSSPGSAAHNAATGRKAAAGGKSGVADVAYAGSLQLVNDQFVGPAFSRATGIAYRGRGGGSFGVAHLIASGEIQPNVFESIGTGPMAALGSRFADWAVGFAGSPLVVAYSPESPFAPQLRAIAEGRRPLRDLFLLMENPRFHLGRTNPQTDPQGQAFVFMVRLAQKRLGLPPGAANRILGGVENPRQIFSEEGILSRLQAGQLDASSAFLPEAVQRRLPYIALPPSINLGDPGFASLYATQSLRLDSGRTVRGAPLEVYVAALKGNPDPGAGIAFAKFLLSKTGEGIYRREGYLLTRPVLWGRRSAIPGQILSALHP